MKQLFILFIILIIPLFSFSQIIGGSGICLTDQAPTLTKDTFDCPLAYDITTDLIYVYQDSQWVVISTGSCNLYDEVAWYVSKTNGDNSRVVKGNPCFPASDPWYVLRNLVESGDKIYIASGTYTYGASGPADAIGTNDDVTFMAKGLDVTIHCEDGVFINQVNGTSLDLFYADSTALTTITGNAIFNDADINLNSQTPSTLNLSCKEITSNTHSMIDNAGDVIVHAEKMSFTSITRQTIADSSLSTIRLIVDELECTSALYNMSVTALNFKVDVIANKFTAGGLSRRLGSAFANYYGIELNVYAKEFYKVSSLPFLIVFSAIADGDIYYKIKADKSFISASNEMICSYGWNGGTGNAYIDIDLGQCIVTSSSTVFPLQSNVFSSTNRTIWTISGNYVVTSTPDYFIEKRNPTGGNEIILENFTLRGAFNVAPLYYNTTSFQKGIVLKNATIVQQNPASPTIAIGNGGSYDLIIFDAYSNYGVTDPNINFPMDSLTVDSVYVR
jgi:hypothetical protein